MLTNEQTSAHRLEKSSAWMCKDGLGHSSYEAVVSQALLRTHAVLICGKQSEIFAFIHVICVIRVPHLKSDNSKRLGGRDVELHYKEYLGALPWRGMQKYVVDGIIAVK